MTWCVPRVSPNRSAALSGPQDQCAHYAEQPRADAPKITHFPSENVHGHAIENWHKGC